MKRFNVKLKYRQQLITMGVWASTKDMAELLAKEAAVKRIDPRKTIWPPVMQQLKIEDIQQVTNKRLTKAKST